MFVVGPWLFLLKLALVLAVQVPVLKGTMATPADGEKEGPGEAVAPVVADPGPSGEAGNPGAGVWSGGKHPTIKAAVEDAAHYQRLLPQYKESFKDRELLTHPEEWKIMRRVVTMVIHDNAN